MFALAIVPAAPAAAATVEVRVGDQFKFTPSTVNIASGDTVRWTWVGPDTNHNVGSSSGEAFDSDPNAPVLLINHPVGFTYSRPFGRLGETSYFCRVHPSMRGRIVVGGGGGDSTAPRLSSVSAKVDDKRLRFTLSEDASVRVKVRARGKDKVLKSYKVTGRSGSNKAKLAVGGLDEGRYNAKLEPVDAAGNKGTAKTARFEIED